LTAEGGTLLQAKEDQGADDQCRCSNQRSFPLIGIKDSPPYLHDDRLLTLEDEFLNLILDIKLSDPEKKNLVAFMRQL